jgi:hypothetical protein
VLNERNDGAHGDDQPDEGYFFWIFLGLPSKKGPDRTGAIRPEATMIPRMRGRVMMGKRILGLIGAALMLLVVATPLAAAEKTVQLEIPGCTS